MSESRDKGMTLVQFMVILFVVAVIYIVLFPVFAQVQNHHPNRALSKARSLCLSVLMYAYDHDDRGPRSTVWMDAVQPYHKNNWLYKDPDLMNPKPDEFGYAYYRPASQLIFSGVANPEEVPLVFQSSDLRWNATGDLSLLANRAADKKGNMVAFMDGHAKYKKLGWPEKPIEIKFNVGK